MFDEDDIEEIKPIFLEESYEGLAVMESGLLDLDHGTPDLDIVNDIFRSAHSIKGGAATFGFNAISEFTHGVETLLDQMRSSERDVTPDVVQLLLQSVDCLRDMLDGIKDNVDSDPEEASRISDQINVMLGAGDSDSAAAETEQEPKAATADEATAKVIRPSVWQISYQPNEGIFKTGNDPVHIIRELRSLGDLKVEANISRLPPLEHMNPEHCYTSWDLVLETEADESKIREAFEWVIDDCVLEISPPAASAAEQPQTDSEPEVSSDAEKSNAEKSDADKEVQSEQDGAKLRVVAGEDDRRKVNDRRASDRRSGAGASTESSSIRVDIDKIDALLNLVGELVITQSSLSRFRKDFSESDLDVLRDSLVELERNTRELQESAMQVRMLPIKVTFSRFPRLVHDLSVQLGKKIELNLFGENTELDKTVLEKVGDPLTHLVRNSVDHGIESSEERLAAGKPAVGMVNLGAYHEAGNIIIEVSDDGGGLDADKILAKAKQQGLVSDDALLSPSQINQLIFQPGFSTADKVTGVSGRGVGMDVVQRNIQELGGRIDVHSEKGVGTTFNIRLPLTLAILDGQLVKIDSNIYVIPVLSITESIVLDPKKVNWIAGKTCVYQFRDENIPVVNIRDVWDFNTDHLDEAEKGLENKLLVVVKSGADLIGLVVDDLMEQQQVVIKSLETNYQQIEGLSGATILGDGTVVLIFDVPGLVHRCLQIRGQNQVERVA